MARAPCSRRLAVRASVAPTPSDRPRPAAPAGRWWRARMSAARMLPALLLAALLPALLPVPLAQAAGSPVALGAGGYRLEASADDHEPPAARHRSAALAGRPAPTNQWFSALLFSPQPEVLYAQPLSFKAVQGALEVALPRREIVPTERRDVEVRYPHRAPLTVSPVSFNPGPAELAAHSDWSIDIDWGAGSEHLRATVAHGSPYAYLHVSHGDLRLALPAAGTRSALPADPRALVLDIGGQTWALFGPAGVRFEQASPTEWIARMPAGKDYASLAALPDASPATLARFTRHAYAFVESTRADWAVDAATGRVTTTFSTRTRAQEGDETAPLQALYPHHWQDNPAVAARLDGGYDSVRGRLKLLAATSFTTERRWSGFVPHWPGLAPGGRAEQLNELLKTDVRNARRLMLENGQGPYWQGKGLQRISTLMAIAEQQGDLAARDQLLKLLEGRIEQWFSGQDRKTYFRYAGAIGSLLAYPEEYFAVEQMNDHHFHYGYWVRAMAEIALRDPAWAGRQRWGAMTDLLVADIATTRRDDPKFPFLRCYDVWEGHSWASGIGLGPDGNNQESSSEAINAWAALVLWGEVNGDAALRDLGIWLYTTEADAIRHYWFDQDHLVFPAEYKNAETSMVFGAKYAHNTWWIDDPRQIKGINLLPLTTASLHLARDPAFIRRSVAELPAQTAVYASRGKRADPPDIWQDIFAQYLGLADPAAGLAAWDRWGAVELGDTRSHALHWLASLEAMGTPRLDITADAPLTSVFQRADGGRTYLAFDAGPAGAAGAAPRRVRFSDGTELMVPARQLARLDKPAQP